MRRGMSGLLLIFGLASAPPTSTVFAQTPQPDDPLNNLNKAIEAMVQQVSPTVVQVIVSKYDTQKQSLRADVVDGWEQGVGAGVIVSADGYIVTNAHVVAQAQQITVRVIPRDARGIGSVLSQSFLKPINANLVGTFAEADLALLKIPTENLPALPIADFGALRQGQMVFAFGSPAGLNNSVSMTLAAALKLPCDSGVIVSDLMPGTPAATAGVKLNDIIVSVNDRPMDNIAAWMGLSFRYVPGSAMNVEVLRGSQTLSFKIVPAVIEEPSDRLADLKDLTQRQIPSLGIMAITLDQRTAAAIGPVRLTSGAVVIARIASPRGADLGLQPGDLIHEFNLKNVFTVDDLRTLAAQLQSGDPAALLVERDGRWFYLAFDMP